MDRRIEELNRLLDEMEGGLDFYRKFVGTNNPRHKGIPYMAATENFTSSTLYPYGKFWRLFKQTTQSMGLTSLWERATGWGGWIYNHRRAMGTLFPRGGTETKVVGDVPTLVPLKIEKDPARAEKALPFLEKMIDLMRRDLIELEQTVETDPQFAGQDEVLESVIRRLGRIR